LFFKKKPVHIEIPTEQTETIEGQETFLVSWFSYRSSPMGMTIDDEKHVQGFTDHQQAESYKTALENAHKLLGNKGLHTEVTLEVEKPPSL
jgi:hypothetical protein